MCHVFVILSHFSCYVTCIMNNRYFMNKIELDKNLTRFMNHAHLKLYDLINESSFMIVKLNQII